MPSIGYRRVLLVVKVVGKMWAFAQMAIIETACQPSSIFLLDVLCLAALTLQVLPQYLLERRLQGTSFPQTMQKLTA